MRRILMTIFGLSILFVAAMASNHLIANDKGKVDFTSNSYEEVLKQAAAEEKPIFIKAYADWCGACKRMESRTLGNEDVQKLLNDNFINMHVDIEEGEGPALVEKFGISGVPAILFLSPGGEVIDSNEGYRGQRRFTSDVEDVLNALGR